MTISRELLRLANELAKASGGLKGYTHVGRNRATSTAYYAVFHSLARMCASELAGLRPSREAFAHIYRSLEHSAPARVFADKSFSSFQTDDVRKILLVCQSLKAERHKADYDPFYYVATRRTMDLILFEATRAVDAIDSLSPRDRRLLAAYLIGRPGRRS